MKKIAVIGSINIDHVLKVDTLPKNGETMISKSYQLKCGGKGANQAVAISRLGNEVIMIGKVGMDTPGEMQIKSLKTSGVGTDGIIIDKLEKTGAAFITVNNIGNNTIVLFSGANSNLSVKDIKFREKYILDCDIIVLQMEIPVETNAYIINSAKEKGKVIVLNLAPAIEINRDILAKVDFLIVNEIEMKYLTGIHFNVEKVDQSISNLRSFFKNNIIVTLGDKGSALIDKKNKSYYLPSYKVCAVDSTAAGDAFIGGFINGLVKNLDLKSCVKIGNAAGALSVKKLGAQSSLPFLKNLEEFLDKNNSGV